MAHVALIYICTKAIGLQRCPTLTETLNLEMPLGHRMEGGIWGGF